ncbi:MAG TPA: DAK2 domain-containing protein, partial [Candidatus Dorea intestinavium]|nr:DAK2 domain-containing protein [Candidatus Dorea intestinavium]
MAVKFISAELLAKMFLAGAKNIEAHKSYINELNVFPVPDGDTGTNMTLTIMSAAEEVKGLTSFNMETLTKAISSGSLRGARGNSGVILSQLLRGFTKTIREEEEIDAFIFVAACNKAKETAYKAVMKPKEGTILTVAAGIAQKATELLEETDDFEVMLPAILEYGQEVLDSTPDMLPVLKEAGVVDSGGQGLMEILRGGYDAFLGKEIDYSTIVAKTASPAISLQKESGSGDIKFGYCTEFIINLEKKFPEKEENKFKDYLTTIGDSIVCVADDDVVKVHVHTNDPGLAIQKALTYGSLSRMKIDNMREEHEEKLKMEALKELEAKKNEKRKEVGFISVSIGEGINNIFYELGIDYIIEGGQTMNPSTEDMLTAIDKVNADTIFILPNNKNIILAANQAKELTTDKNIIVIPTKTIPQGVTAVISYSTALSPEKNAEIMMEEVNNVKTGS